MASPEVQGKIPQTNAELTHVFLERWACTEKNKKKAVATHKLATGIFVLLALSFATLVFNLMRHRTVCSSCMQSKAIKLLNGGFALSALLFLLIARKAYTRIPGIIEKHNNERTQFLSKPYDCQVILNEALTCENKKLMAQRIILEPMGVGQELVRLICTQQPISEEGKVILAEIAIEISKANNRATSLANILSGPELVTMMLCLRSHDQNSLLAFFQNLPGVAMNTFFEAWMNSDAVDGISPIRLLLNSEDAYKQCILNKLNFTCMRLWIKKLQEGRNLSLAKRLEDLVLVLNHYYSTKGTNPTLIQGVFTALKAEGRTIEVRRYLLERLNPLWVAKLTESQLKTIEAELGEEISNNFIKAFAHITQARLLQMQEEDKKRNTDPMNRIIGEVTKRANRVPENEKHKFYVTMFKCDLWRQRLANPGHLEGGGAFGVLGAAFGTKQEFESALSEVGNAARYPRIVSEEWQAIILKNKVAAEAFVDRDDFDYSSQANWTWAGLLQHKTPSQPVN